MTQDELMQVLQAGESSMVEFKRCSELPHTDTFETVCSFANRSGGSIYLGVDDDGQVLGVDSKRVSEIERNVVNVVSNRKMFEPAPMVETEHIEYDERIIVRIWVAPSLRLCGSRAQCLVALLMWIHTSKAISRLVKCIFASRTTIPNGEFSVT